VCGSWLAAYERTCLITYNASGYLRCVQMQTAFIVGARQLEETAWTKCLVNMIAKA
jgi:hypothetical protein